MDGGYGENKEASDGEDTKAKTAGGKDGFRGACRKGFEHFWAEIEDGVFSVCRGLKFTKEDFGIEAEFARVDAEEATGVGEAGEFIELACFELAENIVVKAGAGGSFLEGPTEAKACDTELGAHGVAGFGGWSFLCFHSWTVSRSTRISRSFAPSFGPIIPRASN